MIVTKELRTLGVVVGGGVIKLKTTERKPIKNSRYVPRIYRLHNSALVPVLALIVRGPLILRGLTNKWQQQN